jgi:hypothetical protein
MNPVETILLENIDKPNSLFVFPTDIAASRWADHLLLLQGGGTVAMDKFIAWDTFKQNSVRSKIQEKRSVPSVLRKIFVSRLILENAELCARNGEPVFSSLISRDWAQQAASFASWLAGLLPQLGAWFSKTTGLSIALVTGAGRLAQNFEGDDRDLFILALRYAQFLERHGLFEPAWEVPPFDDTGKECFIFFPESLSDYSEYRDLLATSGHVKTAGLADSGAENLPLDMFFYTNSRSEIAEAALYVRALHEKENIPWDSIAVSIPDAESYEPYVLREFANRNIPFVRRSGKPLASYPAGQFFKSVADCASRDFAFSALTCLLLNSHLPWKDSGEIQKLIDFGINNNCISSWIEEEDGGEQPVNVWEDAFARPLGGIDPGARRFFSDLTRRVHALRGAASFAEIRKHYFSFRERFFDMENCLEETNLILSRCISELMYLAEIEKDFPDAKAPDPFMFLVEYLGEVHYLAQQNASGVVILPYRTAAPAPFGCHVILGASQDNLSAVFSRLGFLPRNKREKLGLTDEDASAAFINLHRLNSQRPAAFFCAEHTFSGYAIPHSRLGADTRPRQRYAEDPRFVEKFSADLYGAEGNFYRESFSAAGPDPRRLFPKALHAAQADGFAAWFSRRGRERTAADGAGDKDGIMMAHNSLLELVRRRFCGDPRFPGKVSVSATAMEPYFRCSLRWFFQRVLHLENIRIEAGLMAENMTGLIYHAILNLFFTGLKEGNNVLSPPALEGDKISLPGTYRGLLETSVNAVFGAFPCLPPGSRPLMSALSARLIRAEKNLFQDNTEKCLAAFLSWFAGYRLVASEASCQAERETFFLNGKVDCMLEDARPDSESPGTVLIVDFKLKNMPSRDDCTGEGENGLADFQLPMYLSLAEENRKLPVHGACFFSIIDKKPQFIFGAARNAISGAWEPKKAEQRIMRGSDKFNVIMGEFAKKTKQYAEEINSGNFSVFDSNFEKCVNCDYHRVCRTVYKIGREQNLTTWGNFDGT